jgi:hypothetical protein
MEAFHGKLILNKIKFEIISERPLLREMLVLTRRRSITSNRFFKKKCFAQEKHLG